MSYHPHTTHVVHTHSVHVVHHYHWYQPHYYYGSGGHLFLTIMLFFALIGVAVWLVKR